MGACGPAADADLDVMGCVGHRSASEAKAKEVRRTPATSSNESKRRDHQACQKSGSMQQQKTARWRDVCKLYAKNLESKLAKPLNSNLKISAVQTQFCANRPSHSEHIQ